MAEVTIIPIGVGPSLSDYIARALRSLDGRVSYQFCATSTIFQVDDRMTAFKLVDEMVESVFEAGAPRVVLILKMDERRDRPDWGVESKVISVLEKLPETGAGNGSKRK